MLPISFHKALLPFLIAAMMAMTKADHPRRMAAMVVTAVSYSPAMMSATIMGACRTPLRINSFLK